MTEDGDDVEGVVRNYLAARGCADFIVEGGLQGLIARWTGVADALERGYTGAFDEYLNDMDLRDILEDAMDAGALPDDATERRTVQLTDARIRAATVACGPLWGVDVADEEAMDPTLQWWYFIRPRVLSDMLREELEAEGLLSDG